MGQFAPVDPTLRVHARKASAPCLRVQLMAGGWVRAVSFVVAVA